MDWLEAPELASLRAVAPGSTTIEVRDGSDRLIDAVRMRVAAAASLSLGIPEVLFFPTPFIWFPTLAERDLRELRLLEGGSIFLHLAVRDAGEQALGGVFLVTAEIDGTIVREIIGPTPYSRDGEPAPDPLPLATNRMMRLEAGSSGLSTVTLAEAANGLTLDLAVEVVHLSTIRSLFAEIVSAFHVGDDDERLVGGTIAVTLVDDEGLHARGGRCVFTDQQPGTIELETFDEPTLRCLAIFHTIVDDGMAEVLSTEEETGLTTTLSFAVGADR